MKKITILLLAMATSFHLFAQEDDEFRTIFQGDIKKIRGFGGPNMEFTAIDGGFAHMMGGGGGIILNDQLIFGGFGVGMTNSIDAKNIDANGVNEYQGYNLEYGYGGLWFGYIIKGKLPIHPVIHTQMGWGSVTVGEPYSSPEHSDNVFVLNPIVELEMNITRFFRLGVGANYRFNFGLNRLDGYGNQDFSGPGGFMSFKFGWF